MSAAPKPAPAKKVKTRPRASLLSEHYAAKALGKACYKLADANLELALQQKSEGKPTPFKFNRKKFKETLDNALDLIAATVKGKSLEIVDQFEKKNSIPVGQSARRYEVEEVSA